jgi:hypothetical protein
MFGNLKTKGFALEATHLTAPDKLCTLLALLAFAGRSPSKPASPWRACIPFLSKTMAAARARCSLSASTRCANSLSQQVPLK